MTNEEVVESMMDLKLDEIARVKCLVYSVAVLVQRRLRMYTFARIAYGRDDHRVERSFCGLLFVC